MKKRITKKVYNISSCRLDEVFLQTCPRCSGFGSVIGSGECYICSGHGDVWYNKNSGLSLPKFARVVDQKIY